MAGTGETPGFPRQRRNSDTAVLQLNSALEGVHRAVHEETTAAYAALRVERLALEAQRQALEKERAAFEEERICMASKGRAVDVADCSRSKDVFFDFSPEVFSTLLRFLRELQLAGNPDARPEDLIAPDAQGQCDAMLCCRCSPQAWNSLDKGVAVVLGDGRHISNKHTPGRNSLIRGKVGYTQGRHYFRVKTLKSGNGNGGHILGVAEENCPLEATEANPSDRFWGLYLFRNRKIHGKKVLKTIEWTGGHEAGTEYGILLDMDNGTLSAIVNRQNLGVLFSGLPKTKLYPAMGVGAAQGCIYETNFLCAPPTTAALAAPVLSEPAVAELADAGLSSQNVAGLGLQIAVCDEGEIAAVGQSLTSSSSSSSDVEI